MKSIVLFVSHLLIFSSVFSQFNTPVNCPESTSSIDLDINNVRAKFLNGGDMFWDQGGDNNARYEVPKSINPNNIKKNAIFSAALWIGGRDRSTGNVMVTAQTYRQGKYSYWPGPLDYNANATSLPAIATNECTFWDKHWKVDRSSIQQFFDDWDSGNILVPSDIDSQLLEWPAKNNPYITNAPSNINMNRDLAPFVDANNDGDYDPMDGDYPKITGEQSIWWIMNDVGNEKEFANTLFPINTLGIGLEIKVEAFAFTSNDAINNATFQKYTITNKGNKILDSTYVGYWVDADLGNYVDDYIGCNPKLSLGYTFNRDDDDDGILGYGTNAPAIGITFCDEILADLNDGIDNDRDGTLDEIGERVKMSNFLTYYNNSGLTLGNPNTPAHHYNYLKSTWLNGQHVTKGGNSGDIISNPITNFMFDGNPILDTGWTESSAGNAPGDRRFLMSMGPFTFMPGETKEFTLAIPFVQSPDGALEALNKLFIATREIKNTCIDGFPGYTSLKERIKNVKIGRVYPTLFHEKLTIDLKSNSKTEFKIYNSLGTLVFENEITNSKTVNIPPLATGIHIYQLRSKNRIQNGKLMKY